MRDARLIITAKLRTLAETCIATCERTQKAKTCHQRANNSEPPSMGGPDFRDFRRNLPRAMRRIFQASTASLKRRQS